MHRWFHAAPVVIAMMTGIAGSQPFAMAAPDQKDDEMPIPFDIPAQPLPSALDAFSAASGYQILTANIGSPAPRSSSVKGVLAPRAALSKLIAGTGVAVEFTAAGAVVLTPVVRSAPSGFADPPPLRPDMAAYDAVLQRGIFGALCRNVTIWPGAYRAALDVWIASTGQVDRAELLDTTGDPERDRRILAALRASVFAAPPPGLPQPTTVVIMPKAMDAAICQPHASAAASP
jgi:TonB family protein